MPKRTIKVVLDTNVLISGFVFGGKSGEILKMVRNREIKGVTSPILLAELGDVLSKKFKYPKLRIRQIEKKMKQIFLMVYPNKLVREVRDDDNRVLEAAEEGDCEYIATGDDHLLILGKYNKIIILSPAKLLDVLRSRTS